MLDKILLVDGLENGKKDQGSQCYEAYDTKVLKKLFFKLNAPQQSSLTQKVVKNRKNLVMQKKSTNDGLRECIKKHLIIQNRLKRSNKYMPINNWKIPSLHLPKGPTLIIGPYGNAKNLLNRSHIKCNSITYH